MNDPPTDHPIPPPYLRNDQHLVGDQIGRVETNTELPDHGDVAAGVHGLHKRLGTGFGDRTWEFMEVIGAQSCSRRSMTSQRSDVFRQRLQILSRFSPPRISPASDHEGTMFLLRL